MNLTFFESPLILALGTLTVLFACTVYALDRRRASHQNHLRRLMRSFVMANAMQSFSVIIEANETTESIATLLNSLEVQGYPKLQVIVFTDTKTDKKIVSELRRMQQKRRNILPVRIIRKKSEGNEHALIRRYATGDALLWLKAEDRLTKDFFIRMSFELLDESCHAISPRLALGVNDTLRSGSHALNLIARQTVTTLLNRNAPQRLLIRRTAYLDATAHNSVSVEHSAITVTNVAASGTNVHVEAIVLSSVLLVGVTSAIYLSYGWQIVTLGFAGTIVLLMALRLFTYPYSLWTKIALTLLLPLWPIVAVALACGTVVRRLLGKLWKRRTPRLAY